jgi:hypothetical protein
MLYIYFWAIKNNNSGILVVEKPAIQQVLVSILVLAPFLFLFLFSGVGDRIFCFNLVSGLADGPATHAANGLWPTFRDWLN